MHPNRDLSGLARSIFHRVSARRVAFRPVIIGGALVLPLALTLIALLLE